MSTQWDIKIKKRSGDKGFEETILEKPISLTENGIIHESKENESLKNAECSFRTEHGGKIEVFVAFIYLVEEWHIFSGWKVECTPDHDAAPGEECYSGYMKPLRDQSIGGPHTHSHDGTWHGTK